MDLRFSGAAAFAMKLSKVALRLWVATSPHEKDSSHGAHSFKISRSQRAPSEGSRGRLSNPPKHSGLGIIGVPHDATNPSFFLLHSHASAQLPSAKPGVMQDTGNSLWRARDPLLAVL